MSKQSDYQKVYQAKVRAAASELGISAAEYLRRRREERQRAKARGGVFSGPVDRRGRKRKTTFPDVPTINGKRTCPICSRAVASRGFPTHWRSHPASERAAYMGTAPETEPVPPTPTPRKKRRAAGAERPEGPAVTFCPFCGEYIAGIFMIPRPER